MEWLILVVLGVASLAAPVIAVSLFARYAKRMVRPLTNQPDAPGGPVRNEGYDALERKAGDPASSRPIHARYKPHQEGLPGQVPRLRLMASLQRRATPTISPGPQPDASSMGLIGLHEAAPQPSYTPACAPASLVHPQRSLGSIMAASKTISHEPVSPALASIFSLHGRRRRARINRLAWRTFVPTTMAGMSLLLTLGLISLGFADLVLVQYMVSFGLCLLVWGLTTDAPAGQGKAHATTDRRGTPSVKQDTRTDLPAAA